MLFDVQIFDQSGCERYNVPIIRTFHEPGASASKRPRGRPRKLPLESLHSNKPKSCKYSPGENLPHRAPTKTNHGTEVAKSTQMKVKAQKTGLHKEKMKAHTKIKGEGTQRRVDIKPTQKPNTATSSSRQRPPTDEVGPKVWNDVESFTSKFPFINICLREANLGKVGLLPIRHEFARAHLPDFKTKITLRTCENRSWEVTYLCNKSYRMFSGGWTSFARENKLEIGNNCIFEVVAQDELRVHIFR
ncbi:B3 domain-containing protein [Cephalotus follicularis]|uniref:B3 domain-containing protein n=1 Tax=Cephalotus follicularis TaxID=3775 RepID=A0A1Q3CWY7_CEPFO|nr:B3 domain-containing protein [Cephalotus follicularis]